MMPRIPCCVPFCKGTTPGNPGDEGLCQRHWTRAAGPLRRRYEAAWTETNRADQIGMEDVDACVRVVAAWNDLKAHVVRMAV